MTSSKGSHTETVLQRSTDTIFAFFLAYLLSRYSTYVVTNKLAIHPYRHALDGAACALIITALVSYIGVARSNDIPSSQAKFGTVLLTSTLVAAGTFSGLTGTDGITAGIICGVLGSICAINKMTIWLPSQVGVLGSIIAGKFMVETDMATGLNRGIVAAVVVTVFSVVLMSYIASGVVLTIISYLKKDADKNSLNLYIGLPTSLFGSVGVGTLAWLGDNIVLEFLETTKHSPDGFILGLICVIVIVLLSVL